MRKKISAKIRALITRSLNKSHRGIFLLVGDRARDQVINLFNLWQSIRSTRGEAAQPRVLWCYKDELGFSSQQKKRQREVTKLQKQGLYEAEAATPFELFLTATEIRFCYYREAGRVLGNTFDILILQDFEGLTANLLCQTVETVRGGGLVFFLLRGMTTLRQLSALSMDVHARYRTQRFPEVHPHFNERLLLALCACEAALFADDELNLLGIADAGPADDADEEAAPRDGLAELLQSVEANPALRNLVGLCKTLDQAKVLLALLDAVSAKERPGGRGETIFLTADRGRGKSAALGLAVGGALMSGATHVCVSAGSSENLGVVFEFARKALESSGFARGVDFTEKHDAAEALVELELIIGEAPPDNLLAAAHRRFRRHRLTFLPPGSALPLTAELLVVDEAAAVPLSLLRPLVIDARCPVLISSTVHGYEGTGRSLSLKLVEELRGDTRRLSGGRTLRELQMTEPIRYADGDPVEQWLSTLLCLQATAAAPLRRSLPPPAECRLFLVRKETLFSFNRSSERFLAEMWALFVSSHYKNSPNDLQLLSDAPAHFLAVLLGPLAEGMPDILVALQCAFEGEVGAQSAQNFNGRTFRPAGDLAPWALAEQFLDKNILQYLSVRVVRIAVHPKAARLGYGSRALEALHAFFTSHASSAPAIDMAELWACSPAPAGEVPLGPRKGLPPLLKDAAEVRPLRVSYVSVSFGLTRPLYAFWAKSAFLPFYLKQTRNEQTGEFTCMMLKPVEESALNFGFFGQDFRRRFARLLSPAFAGLESELALAVLNPPLTSDIGEDSAPGADNLAEQFSLLDLRRLQSYCRNLSEHYLIRDLLPRLVELYVLRQFPGEQALAYSQALILVGIGLQNRSVEYFADKLRFSHAQVLSLFNKAIRKLYRHLESVVALKTGAELGFGREEAAHFDEPAGAAIEEFEEHLAKQKGSLRPKSSKRAKAI